ncbi:hypothetical protein ACFOU2_16870 [Bacillus songklensis]|uniref:Uncharacterized protein n=1 Tax=Bacillus songklensis TaxID=1069116 RepID=A0ABV8B411_9BACI
MNISKEEIHKIAAVLMQQLTQGWNPVQLQGEVKNKILDQRNHAKTEEGYMNLLVTNVAYATEENNKLQQMFERILADKAIPTSVSLESSIYEAKFRIKENLSQIVPSYVKHFSLFQDPAERIRSLELTYGPMLISNRIKTQFLLAFANKENYETSSIFFTANPADAAEAFHQVSGVFASMILNGLHLEEEKEKREE